MIEFRCARCGTDMAVPESLAGLTETCPECKMANPVPTPIPSGMTRPVQGKTQKKPTGRRKAMMLLGIIGGVIVVLAFVGYFAAVRFGPEDWRISTQGKAAYAALDELHTSIETPIGRDEYGQCVRRALLKVKPYLDSDNAKSCPAFSEWIGKTMACYAKAAEDWNEPVPDYETTALGERLKYRMRESHVQLVWAVASQCLVNAKCVMEGKPNKVQPLPKDAIDVLSGKTHEAK